MIQINKMKNLNDFRFGFFFGIIISCLLMYYYSMPRLIEKRAVELNMVKYNSKEDEFLIKDSITLSSDDFNYLKHGSFKRDFFIK